MHPVVATVAATQPAKAAYVVYKGYSQTGEGVSNNVDLIRILVQAAGRATGGTTTNFTPSIQISAAGAGVPSTTAASNTTLFSLTATAFNSASGNWVVKVELLWDPVSGQINGLGSGYAGSGGRSDDQHRRRRDHPADWIHCHGSQHYAVKHCGGGNPGSDW